MLDQLQVTSLSPSPDLSTNLATLLKHPEVIAGIESAHWAYDNGLFDEVDMNLSTEDALISAVEDELSGERHQREQRISHHLGHPTISYLHRLGFTLAWIDLAFAEQQKGEQA
ncbi:MAG: hypothetical protein J2P36_21885 [Ktedonobacteraceae bacterium]|nr:hypothetical protein [Ktedonobacteraceae bacterium]